MKNQLSKFDFSTPKMSDFLTINLVGQLTWTNELIDCGLYKKLYFLSILLRHRGVVVITTQLHSTKPELRFCAGLNHACAVSEIRNGEDLWKWSLLEIMLKRFSLVNHTTKTTYHWKKTPFIYHWISSTTLKGEILVALATSCELFETNCSIHFKLFCWFIEMVS